MLPDYRDAAERHWKDAQYLSTDNRTANADHLLGLSAECALKAVMQGVGMTIDPGGVPTDKSHRVHINKLWDEFSTFSHTRGGARFAIIIDAHPNPFIDWDIAQRYCHRAGITNAILENHRQGALNTRKVLNNAVLEGVI